VNAAAKQGDLAAAEGWLEQACSEGIAPSIDIYNAVIRTAAKRGNPEAAEHWLERARRSDLRPNGRTFNAMLLAAAKKGDLFAANKWFQASQRAGMHLDLHGFTVMVHAAAKSGNLTLAEKWFRLAKKAGHAADLVMYTSMLHAAVLAGNLTAAERWFSHALDAGVQPDVVAYTNMIEAHIRAGDMAGAETYFNHIIRNENLEPTRLTYSAFINGYAHLGALEDALWWFRRMESSGLPATVVQYNQVLHACVGHSHHRSSDDEGIAQKLFVDMLFRGVKPTKNTLMALQRALGEAKLIELCRKTGTEQEAAEFLRFKMQPVRH